MYNAQELMGKIKEPFNVAIFDGDTLIDVIIFVNADAMGDPSDIVDEWLDGYEEDYGELNYVVTFEGEQSDVGTFNGEYDASDDLYEAYRDRQMGL